MGLLLEIHDRGTKAADVLVARFGALAYVKSKDLLKIAESTGNQTAIASCLFAQKLLEVRGYNTGGRG